MIENLINNYLTSYTTNKIAYKKADSLDYSEIDKYIKVRKNTTTLLKDYLHYRTNNKFSNGVDNFYIGLIVWAFIKPEQDINEFLQQKFEEIDNSPKKIIIVGNNELDKKFNCDFINYELSKKIIPQNTEICFYVYIKKNNSQAGGFFNKNKFICQSNSKTRLNHNYYNDEYFFSKNINNNSINNNLQKGGQVEIVINNFFELYQNLIDNNKENLNKNDELNEKYFKIRETNFKNRKELPNKSIFQLAYGFLTKDRHIISSMYDMFSSSKKKEEKTNKNKGKENKKDKKTLFSSLYSSLFDSGKKSKILDNENSEELAKELSNDPEFVKESSKLKKGNYNVGQSFKSLKTIMDNFLKKKEEKYIEFKPALLEIDLKKHCRNQIKHIKQINFKIHNNSNIETILKTLSDLKINSEFSSNIYRSLNQYGKNEKYRKIKYKNKDLFIEMENNYYFNPVLFNRMMNGRINKKTDNKQLALIYRQMNEKKKNNFINY